LSLAEWAQYFSFNGLSYPILGGSLSQRPEEVMRDFSGYVEGVYRRNGIVFACMEVRRRLFSEARLQFQRVRNGQPGDLYGTQSLAALEVPWPGGSTRDLLSRMIQDVDLGGNFFAVRHPGGVWRLRPDWVTVVSGSPRPDADANAHDTQVIGYVYQPGGPGGGSDPVAFRPETVAHWMPTPDPAHRFLGMSWLTPIIREILADGAATQHKLKFFEQGAPQPLDAKILTPDGWRTMGAIAVGDEVIGRDGRPHPVDAIYPQGERDIYRVVFSDGAQAESTDDHIWHVASYYDRKRSTHRTMTLREIMDDGIAYDSGPLKWSVPFVRPVEFADPGPRPIDPYLFGLLIGDGSFRGGGVTLATHADDANVLEAVAVGASPDGVSVTRRDRGGWSEMYFKGPSAGRSNPMTAAARELGVMGTHGRDKTIPDVYLRAPIEDRIALLQGIVDSDGHISEREGNVSVTTTSHQLAADIVELVGGLGGSASFSRCRGRDTLVVRVKRLPDWITPCRLERKAMRYRATSRSGQHRYIESVEFVGRKPAQCIHLNSPEHLYVTDDFVVTHNTPNLVMQMDPEINPESFQRYVELFRENEEGVDNAYRTLFTTAAQVQVVGKDLQQIDFKVTQGAGETRIAAAAGVAPIVAGLSEGLQAATYSNYGQARRHVADGTLRPLWGSACEALNHVVTGAGGDRLWYDDRQISFLQEDQKDAAVIQQTKAITARELITAGYDPDTVAAFIQSDDWSTLAHTGLTSVQLQPPGAQMNGAEQGAGDALIAALNTRVRAAITGPVE